MIYKLFEVRETTFLRNRRDTPSHMRREVSLTRWRNEHGYFTATVGQGGQRFRRAVARVRGAKQHPVYVPAKVGPLKKIRAVHPAAHEGADVRNLRKRIRRARPLAAPGSSATERPRPAPARSAGTRSGEPSEQNERSSSRASEHAGPTLIDRPRRACVRGLFLAPVSQVASLIIQPDAKSLGFIRAKS